MRSDSFILAVLGALAATAGAYPAVERQSNTLPPLKITNLMLQSSPKGNTTLSFNILDPSPLTNATSRCSGAWNTQSGYAIDQYTVCTNPEFEWTFLAYNGTQSFVLGAGHSFEDDQLGSPPYNYLLTFSQAPFNASNLDCVQSYQQTTCRQPRNATVYAPVYAVSG